MRRRILILALALSGCAELPPPPAGPVTLLGPQLQQQDRQLVGQKFRTLLDFEHDADAAFVASAAKSPAAGHTGRHAVRCEAPVRINVDSLLFGARLPGDWTLLGAYVRPASGGDVAVTLLADGKPVCRNTRNVPAGAWAFAAVDLTDATCRATLPAAKSMTLSIEAASAVDLDDVLLVDNRRTLVDDTSHDGWTVQTSGLTTQITAKTWNEAWPAGGNDGWLIDEANAVRVRAHDLAGHARTLLCDGRFVEGGVLARWRGDGADLAASHRSPADVTLDDAMGRVDRQTDGDAENDGYNERRCAYELVATKPRLTFTLRPRGATLACPVVEIRGLPPGDATVLVQGRLFDHSARTDEGTLLVLLPLRLDTPTEVTVSVSDNR